MTTQTEGRTEAAEKVGIYTIRQGRYLDKQQRLIDGYAVGTVDMFGDFAGLDGAPTLDEARAKAEAMCRADDAELLGDSAAEREHDEIYNEGGEGYNPHRRGAAPGRQEERDDGRLRDVRDGDG